MLDLETFTFLSRALETTIAPIVILASNRGKVPIHISSPSSYTTAPNTSNAADDALIPTAHGIPPDLLARLLIIPTLPYSPNEIRTIISLRARTEGVNLSEEALERVSKKGEEVSLRYALQLLAPAQVLAKVAGRGAGSGSTSKAVAVTGDAAGANGESASGAIEVQDVEECEGLFLDARRSAGVLESVGTTGRNGFIA